jgi:hypothetical protein
MRSFLKFWSARTFGKGGDKAVAGSGGTGDKAPPTTALTPEQEMLRFLEQEVKREDLIELVLPGLFREGSERIAAIKTELAGIRGQLETLYRRREETFRLAQGSVSSVPGSDQPEGVN